ncbi:hypothetical protein [uncultured Aquimarina sp.]|uniref:hypothetical protein n=1 Tax=uncultured Aquimarina sp. TaxID=575652 RepID=UPI00262192C6|nr:hypothetical protein [uncultured Aquimarina sp.]
MAPLKFEDSIKEKLEQRTIRPSNGSWEKLEGKLDDQLSQKKTKKYWWLGIAASIAGFLIVTTVYMNSGNTSTSFDVEFVDANKEVIQKKESIDIVEVKETKSKGEAEVVKENSKAVESQIKQNTVVESSKKESKSLEKNENFEKVISEEYKPIIAKKAFKENSKEAVAIQIDTIKNKIIEEDISLQITTDIIQSKVSDIIAKVKELEKNNDVITDEEVDALLRKAQHEITTQQILKSNTVNASALLLDVESELDESFKDRVFEALKTGFEKLKTTVAERDN